MQGNLQINWPRGTRYMITNIPKQNDVAGCFDFLIFLLLINVMVFGVFLLPCNYFGQKWSREYRHQLLRKYFTEEEIRNQNIHFTQTRGGYVLSTGKALPYSDWIEELWHASFPSIAVGCCSVFMFFILDYILLKGRIWKYYRYLFATISPKSGVGVLIHDCPCPSNVRRAKNDD